jgi:hypothetical protein
LRSASLSVGIWIHPKLLLTWLMVYWCWLHRRKKRYLRRNRKLRLHRVRLPQWLSSDMLVFEWWTDLIICWRDEQREYDHCYLLIAQGLGLTKRYFWYTPNK